MNKNIKLLLTSLCIIILVCTSNVCLAEDQFYGTKNDFAKEAIYFVITDRFVSGDNNNDHSDQGIRQDVDTKTWDRPISFNRNKGNIGYLGGDFKGIIDNADYIKDLGFTAVWITPIVDNPDEAFTGGEFGKDKGKTGYHGYWGVNFFKVDEHLESEGLTFKDFSKKLHNKNLKVVLDIVCNHGSPAYTMLLNQSGYGKIYDENDELLADHQNTKPGSLDHTNKLQTFYNKFSIDYNQDKILELAQLSDLKEGNQAVRNYLVDAYLKWINQGADAFRIDTICWMDDSFWAYFSDQIRKQHPEFFMFGENFNFDPKTISRHQYPFNGGISILDFPLKKVLSGEKYDEKGVFESPGSNYSVIYTILESTDDIYYNPYEVVTFYDNHDVQRFQGLALQPNYKDGYIDANNFIFTSRGIPCIYYGSEMAFESGKAEHEGNRNYYGVNNINDAKNEKIYKKLKSIAEIRKKNIALQKGLQINLEEQFRGNKAAFYRVYQDDTQNQTALVLLNKGNDNQEFMINKYLSSGDWIDVKTNDVIHVNSNNPELTINIEPHEVKVLILNSKADNIELIEICKEKMNN